MMNLVGNRECKELQERMGKLAKELIAIDQECDKIREIFYDNVWKDTRETNEEDKQQKQEDFFSEVLGERFYMHYVAEFLKRAHEARIDS